MVIFLPFNIAIISTLFTIHNYVLFYRRLNNGVIIQIATILDNKKIIQSIFIANNSRNDTAAFIKISRRVQPDLRARLRKRA